MAVCGWETLSEHRQQVANELCMGRPKKNARRHMYFRYRTYFLVVGLEG